MYRVLVQVLMDLDDSHTTMILPPRSDHYEYGFGIQMIGDSCYVTSVKKDSDASKQGLQVGDELLALGRFSPNRRDLWKMLYVLYRLDPTQLLDVKVKKPDGSERVIRITAKTLSEKEYRAEQKAKREARKNKEKYEPFKCQEISSDVIACKLYSFVVEKNDIDKMMTLALKHPKFILDLRGNSGGYVAIEQYVVSHFFDREVKIADLVTRKKTETRTTKPIVGRQYKGELAVLVDSNSASASEMTARVLQLEHRAKIYGDASSGSVMTSISVPFLSVLNTYEAAIVRVGMSVTIADVIMRDGSRLEHVGVVPDELLQPTGSALFEKTDPLLSYVAQKMGAQLTPEKAGSFNFLLPKDEDEGDGDSDDDDKK
jgi:C-terminal processing protease CtpA/Prc